jgi:Tfp pilus assembly protein PilF
LSYDPVRAQLDVGVALARSGNYDGAVAAFRRAIETDPRSLAAYVNLGVAFATAGRLDGAIAAFRDAISIAPNVAQLHFNLGAALKRRGALAEAIVSYERAAALEPSVAAFNNLGSAMREHGRIDPAITAFRRALQIDDGVALVHLNLGTALQDKGDLEAATNSYERACTLDPGLGPAQRALAQALVERDFVEPGFARFRRYAARSREKPSMSAMRTSGPARKQRHDSEQADYLLAEGALGTRARGSGPPSWPPEEERGAPVDDSAHATGPVLDPVNDTARIEPAWLAANPKIVVLDNLLTPEALDALRAFCWRSAIWNSSYPGGYLGAFPEDGFAPTVLARASAELRARFPAIFRRYPLKLWWAFKCDSGAPGIGIHADFAAVNLNFWITPDEANLDPESGGLRIWNLPAPLGWDYRKYNADPEGIRSFLAGAGAKSVTVPYRANRAVIFDSNLFHETHRPRFKDGYLNRRINITLLYGLRESVDERP